MGRYIKTNRSNLSRVKRWMIGLLPRKFHCFSIGAQKTGTTTIANMFKKHYRASHEADPGKTTQLMVDYLKGDISKHRVETILLKRDNLLNLEIESTHPLVYVSNVLPQIFPDAKFIVTIREPYSLLDSRLNWHKTPSKPAWKYYNNYLFKKYCTAYTSEEEILKKYNLYSLDTYLAQYAGHYNRIFANIPQEKRIFIKTNELNASPGKLATFLHIEKDTLTVAHSKKNRNKAKILEEMDQSFVRNKIWHHCSHLIQRFFPDTLHLYSQ